MSNPSLQASIDHASAAVNHFSNHNVTEHHSSQCRHGTICKVDALTPLHRGYSGYSGYSRIDVMVSNRGIEPIKSGVRKILNSQIISLMSSATETVYENKLYVFLYFLKHGTAKFQGLYSQQQ